MRAFLILLAFLFFSASANADHYIVGLDWEDKTTLAPSVAQGHIENILKHRVDDHEVTHRYKYIPFVLCEMDKKDAKKARRHGLSVHEDELAYPHLAQSVPIQGGDAAQQAGALGTGHAVAILDTGVDTSHRFFANGARIIAEACFDNTENCPDGTSEMIGPGAGIPCLHSGCRHGSHVAGISAGSSLPEPNGMAVRADIIAVQVFRNNGQNPSASISDIIKGIEHVTDLKMTLVPRTVVTAINLSLGTGPKVTPCDTYQPAMKAAIDVARSRGIITVASAGNNGDPDRLSAPACYSTVVSVGCTTKDRPDKLCTFTNRARTLTIHATGLGIRSSVPGGTFASLSGTSMSAPHVAGAFAMLAGKFPAKTPATLIDIMKREGDRIPGIATPRLQIARAVGAIPPNPPLPPPPPPECPPECTAPPPPDCPDCPPPPPPPDCPECPPCDCPECPEPPPCSQDTDVDGEIDRTDQCPQTPLNEDVDTAGCSLDQFCRLRLIERPFRARHSKICRRSDWLNDSPVGKPLDCEVDRQVVRDKDDDLCVSR